MKKLLAFLILIFVFKAANGQIIAELIIRPADFIQLDDQYQFSINAMEIEALDFWSIGIKSRQNLNQQLIYTSGLNRHVLREYAHGSSDQFWIAEQLFIDGNQKQFKLTAKKRPTENIEVRLFHVPVQEVAIAAPKKVKPSRSACPCPQPEYLDREGWCPGGYCPQDATPTPTAVDHLIVHHAASSNVSSNWAAVVQSIWDHHVNNNGWDDIGYNWLIDPNGNIYEGRGDDIQGAHFCGNNSTTAGICLLGDFTDQLPSGAAMSSLSRILAWKACDRSIDPLTSSFHASSNQLLPNIAGHRDGCSTECPGNTFYPTLGDLRLLVQDQIDFTCANLPPPTNLTAETTSTTSITLEWNDNAQEETAYLLERAPWTNQDYEQIATIAQDGTSYLDESVEPNSVYFYRIRATNEIDTTAYSNEVGISTVIQNITSITDFNIKVYPNPASAILNIKLNDLNSRLREIKIYNLLNQIIWSEENTNKELININTAIWPRGSYFIHFIFEEKNIFHPILIQ